jgi:hypothetical protein
MEEPLTQKVAFTTLYASLRSNIAGDSGVKGNIGQRTVLVRIQAFEDYGSKSVVDFIRNGRKLRAQVR